MPLRNVVVIALVTIFALACYSVASKNRYANLFAEALDVIDRESLHRVPARKLFTSAMHGMMQELDEHSMYIAGDLYQAIDEDMNQEFGGVGMYVEIAPDTKRLVVLAPIPNTPAYEVGVQIGDEIIEIAGQSTDELSRTDAIKLLRGPKGTPVDVLLKRNDKEISVQLVRATIPVPSVSGDWQTQSGEWNYVLKEDPRIGYIRLQQFGKLSAKEIAFALDEINGKVDGVILDLRNNAGGLLSAALDICDMFLDKEVAIVRTKGRDQRVLEEHFASRSTSLNARIPVVVLVNRNSASASEIVAGCLQDHERAVIIGEQSWGKGTVQNLIPMERGQSALKLTIASFWRPSDRQIDRYDPVAVETGDWGIQPNNGFEIELSETDVYDNIRHRSFRDLSGLNPEGAEAWLEQSTRIANEARKSASETASETDAEAIESQELDGEAVPHIDRPLERARQYLKSLVNKAIAA